MKLRTLLAALMMFCILSPALGQAKPAAPAVSQQPQKPAEADDDVVKITTNLVQVDAVVTKDGKLVKDLTADDFEIYEDGRKQAITSFAYISNMPGASSQPVNTARDKGAEVVPFAPVKSDVPRRTVALVVDDLGLSAESVSHVRQQLKKFLAEEIQPNDLVAVIRTSGEVGALQQFTNDRRVLNRATEQVRWSPCSRVGLTVFPILGRGPTFGSNSRGVDESPCSQYSLLSTMKVLRFVLDAMGELPGRKSMVVFSDSMPIENQEITFDPDAPTAGVDTDQRNYRLAFRKLAEKAIRSSVVIYSVDTQGLQYTGITAADSISGNFRDITNQINNSMASRSRLLISRREGGEMISRQTGGFQIRNSNSFELDRILEDQSGYYLIGYRPTDETFNRKFHHIKAKVKRTGMTLRTRFGFFGVSEEEASKNQRSARDLTNLALMSPFGKQDINLDLTSFFANDKTAGSMIRSFVYLDAADLTFNSVNGKREGSIELHGAIFGDNGSLVQQLTRGASLSLTEEDYEQAKRHGMNITFDMPVKNPGAYQVRIAARDRNSSHIGSAGQFVAVPNLNNNRLAVSGIVLGTDSKGFALADPGTRRYKQNSNVHFGYIVYNAANESGALRNLVMQTKLFRDGKVVSTGPETPISAANQTDLASLYSGGIVHLPAELEPGNYYLQVLVVETIAKDKKTVLVQWANFDIEK